MPIPFIVAGLVGAVVGGTVMANAVDEELREKDEKLTKSNLEAEKAKKIITSHEKHTKYILALSALGAAMANADGEVTKDEVIEIREFINGAANGHLPQHITKEISKYIANPPSFNKVIDMWSEYSTDINEFKKAETLLISVMESDGEAHEREIAFLEAFKIKMQEKHIERLENGK